MPTDWRPGMTEHLDCLVCGGNSLTPETGIAQPEGFVHKDCWVSEAPKVEFFKEIVCPKHKRVAPTCDDCQRRHYTINGETEINGVPIASVTTILKETGDKFGVGAWWGMGVGAKGARELAKRQTTPLADIHPDAIVPLLQKFQLTTNHVRDDAAARGTSVHAVGEKWAETGDIDREGVTDEQAGYVDALQAFVTDNEIRPLEAEVLTGSAAMAYAGTFDLLARADLTTWDDKKLRGTGIIDWKTKSKPPKGKKRDAYESHHLQLRAYNDARVEQGNPEADFQAVVNLYPDGTYAVIEGVATSDEWLTALKLYRSLTSLRQRIAA